MCLCVCLNVCLYPMCIPNAGGGQKKAWDLLGLDLQTGVSCSMGAGNLP